MNDYPNFAVTIERSGTYDLLDYTFGGEHEAM